AAAQVTISTRMGRNNASTCVRTLRTTSSPSVRSFRETAMPSIVSRTGPKVYDVARADDTASPVGHDLQPAGRVEPGRPAGECGPGRQLDADSPPVRVASRDVAGPQPGGRVPAGAGPLAVPRLQAAEQIDEDRGPVGRRGAG